MSVPHEIHVNGERRQTAAANVAELLRELDLLPSQVAVELNGTVLFRQEFQSSGIKSGDRLEIIRVVAGG
jgi:thiamine biosynthesis protein ThiS